MWFIFHCINPQLKCNITCHKHSIVKEHRYQRHMVWALHLIISISEWMAKQPSKMYEHIMQRTAVLISHILVHPPLGHNDWHLWAKLWSWTQLWVSLQKERPEVFTRFGSFLWSSQQVCKKQEKESPGSQFQANANKSEIIALIQCLSDTSLDLLIQTAAALPSLTS